MQITVCFYIAHFHRNKDVCLVFDWLYKDAELYLKRKHDIYLQWINNKKITA